MTIEVEVLSSINENRYGSDKVDLLTDLSCQTHNILRTVLEKSQQRRFKFVYSNEVADFILDELQFYRLAELKPKPKDSKNRIFIQLTPKGAQLAAFLIKQRKLGVIGMISGGDR